MGYSVKIRHFTYFKRTLLKFNIFTVTLREKVIGDAWKRIAAHFQTLTSYYHAALPIHLRNRSTSNSKGSSINYVTQSWRSDVRRHEFLTMGQLLSTRAQKLSHSRVFVTSLRQLPATLRTSPCRFVVAVSKLTQYDHAMSSAQRPQHRHRCGQGRAGQGGAGGQAGRRAGGQAGRAGHGRARGQTTDAALCAARLQLRTEGLGAGSQPLAWQLGLARRDERDSCCQMRNEPSRHQGALRSPKVAKAALVSPRKSPSQVQRTKGLS